MVWRVYEKVNGVVIPTPYKHKNKNILIDIVINNYGWKVSDDISEEEWCETKDPKVSVKWVKEET